MLRSLLNDRQERVGSGSRSGSLLHRSVYRQLLFLKLLLYPETFDIGKVGVD